MGDGAGVRGSLSRPVNAKGAHDYTCSIHPLSARRSTIDRSTCGCPTSRRIQLLPRHHRRRRRHCRPTCISSSCLDVARVVVVATTTPLFVVSLIISHADYICLPVYALTQKTPPPFIF